MPVSDPIYNEEVQKKPVTTTKGPIFVTGSSASIRIRNDPGRFRALIGVI